MKQKQNSTVQAESNPQSIDITAIVSDIAEIKKLLKESTEPNPLGDWISEKKTQELLGKKKVSLWKLRKEGKIIASGTRPLFYSLKSIQAYINGSLSN